MTPRTGRILVALALSPVGVSALGEGGAGPIAAQAALATPSAAVVAIEPPGVPMPPEGESAGVTRFSFVRPHRHRRRGCASVFVSSEPDLTAYLRTNAGQKVDLEHVARPGTKAGDNPYHFVLVRVDGNSWEAEVIGVDWGRGFAPYQSNRRRLGDDTPNP